MFDREIGRQLFPILRKFGYSSVVFMSQGTFVQLNRRNVLVAMRQFQFTTKILDELNELRNSDEGGDIDLVSNFCLSNSKILGSKL